MIPANKPPSEGQPVGGFVRPAQGRQTAPWAYAAVDLVSVAALTVLAIWGGLRADYAAAGIMLLAGVGVNSLSAAFARR